MEAGLGGGTRGFASRIGPLSKLIASFNTSPPPPHLRPISKDPGPLAKFRPFPHKLLLFSFKPDPLPKRGGPTDSEAPPTTVKSRPLPKWPLLQNRRLRLHTMHRPLEFTPLLPPAPRTNCENPEGGR